MANTKSAAKHARQSLKHYARNRWYRVRARTFVKRARETMGAGEAEKASEALRTACRALDMAAQKGAIHRNNASRRKSRLMKAFNKALAPTQG
jgi:small subunit ribosomal protein S20